MVYAWPLACRIGDESQQPTCPHVRHSRKCTQVVPRLRHSSHPCGVRGVTGRTRIRCGSLTVVTAAPATEVNIQPCSSDPRHLHIINPASSAEAEAGNLGG